MGTIAIDDAVAILQSESSALHESSLRLPPVDVNSWHIDINEYLLHGFPS